MTEQLINSAVEADGAPCEQHSFPDMIFLRIENKQTSHTISALLGSLSSRNNYECPLEVKRNKNLSNSHLNSPCSESLDCFADLFPSLASLIPFPLWMCLPVIWGDSIQYALLVPTLVHSILLNYGYFSNMCLYFRPLSWALDSHLHPVLNQTSHLDIFQAS